MYESKAKVKEITAVSRVALKIRDNFYTVEYTETRTIPDEEGIDIEKERTMLWNDVNAIVDDQANDIKRCFSNSNQ